MGWPTIDDQRLPRGVYSSGGNPPAKKTARAESVADGFHTIRGPWWCRDLLPEYVTDYVWNPINEDLYVDLSGLTDVRWMNTYQTGCAPTGMPTPADAFPGGQPVKLTKCSYYGSVTSWFYGVWYPPTGDTISFIRVALSRIEDIALINRPPICYALAIFAERILPDWEQGCIWFGIKSGDTPRGEYGMMCTNSARPVQFNDFNGMRVYYITGGITPTHQLCPCNIDYTPQILSFTVT